MKLILFVLASVLCFFAAPVAAQSSYASYADCGLPGESIVNCPSIADDSAHGLSPGQVLTTETAFPEPTPFWATASVRSGFGNLGVSSNSHIMGTVPSPSTATGSASAMATYTDSVTVLSSSLAAGSAVDVTFTTTVDFSIDLRSSTGNSGNPEAGAYAWLFIFSGVAGNGYDRCYGHANAPGVSCTEIGVLGSSTVSFTDVVHTQVGASIAFQPFLGAFSKTYLYNGTTVPFTGDASAKMSAINTMNTYIGSDANVQFLSTSGHDYAIAAVPEPSTWIMFVVGVLTATLVGTRRRGQKCRRLPFLKR
jgi:hypothetical protein